MKKELCMMAIGLLLAGCSADEEIANVHTSESNVIGFNVVSNNPQTKAEIITGENLSEYPFAIYAFKPDGSLFMGNIDEALGKNGVRISNQNGVWTYVNSNDKKYWPHDPLNFYAVYPVLSEDDSDRFMSMLWNINSVYQSIYYTACDEFGMSIRTKNIDVMYAVAPYQNKTTNNGIVHLTFKHALSQILFKAMTEDSTIEVQIKGMSIHNIHYSGSFSLPSFDESGQIGEVNNSLWSLFGNPAPHYTIGLNGTLLEVDHNEKEISGGENAMLVIPQQLTPWNPQNGGIHVADTHKQSYLQITCKIWHNAHYFVGNENEYGDIYVPFEADWQPGKRYIYTLRFGGGYTEEGEEIDLIPITFGVEVSEWSDAVDGEIIHPEL